MATEQTQHVEQALTPSDYIAGHLSFNAQSIGEGSFWTLHVDTLVMSVIWRYSWRTF
jgi:F-type H+-transporting ATPase subunit a